MATGLFHLFDGDAQTDGSEELHDALVEFGREQAGAGAGPHEVLDAVTDAVDRVGSRCAHLSDAARLPQVALGAWATERVRLAQHDQCVDSFTGVHTAAFLREQVGQLYERCASLKLRPSAVCGLIAIRVEMSDLDLFTARSVLDAVSARLQAELTSGETIAALDRGAFVALVPVDTIAERAVSLEMVLALEPALGGLVWQVTASPLPADVEGAVRQVDDLLR